MDPNHSTAEPHAVLRPSAMSRLCPQRLVLTQVAISLSPRASYVASLGFRGRTALHLTKPGQGNESKALKGDDLAVQVFHFGFAICQLLPLLLVRFEQRLIFRLPFTCCFF